MTLIGHAPLCVVPIDGNRDFDTQANLRVMAMIDVDICVFVVLRQLSIATFKKSVQIPECLLSQGCELYHEWQGGIYWDLDDVRFDMTTGRVCIVIKDDCLDDETDAADSLAKWPQIGFVTVD